MVSASFITATTAAASTPPTSTSERDPTMREIATLAVEAVRIYDVANQMGARSLRTRRSLRSANAIPGLGVSRHSSQLSSAFIRHKSRGSFAACSASRSRFYTSLA